MNNSDTIAAISTALGNSGINIIRVSGIDSFKIVSKIFLKGKSQRKVDIESLQANTIHFGYIFDDDICIDEVLISIFKAPNSYTTENVIEINCHGGSYVTKQILMIIISKGARLAEPGEFTKRAFLNGRIDLSQAEAVMDIIKSQNEYSLQSCVNHLRGDISNKIKILREDILKRTAYIEAALDDPEHYDLEGYSNELREAILSIINELKIMASSYNDGRIMIEGINTVIIGKPNVGKSSIMNYILHDDKAIVTDIPGTTRDVIEYKISIGKITLNLIDTAGIHNTEDKIESIGINKSIEWIDKADLILSVFDNSREYEEEDKNLVKLIENKVHINIFNKCDLEDKLTESIDNNSLKNDCIKFSAKQKKGYNELVNRIEELFYSNVLDVKNEFYITNMRHVELINKAIKSASMVIEGIDNCMSEDFLTIDMMDAYNLLGEIIGETIADDLADKIFSEFCMGK